METDIRLGDFFCRSMDSWEGPLIRFGQFLNGDGARQYEHAGLCIAVKDDKVTTIEAQPGGARYFTYTIEKASEWLWSDFELSASQREAIVFQAKLLRGCPYNWLDYVAIAAHRLHVPGLASWSAGRVQNESRLICSQLVDLAYRRAGVNLFTDGRLPQSVTPGDLSGLILHDHTAK